jgi:hypothetical protein
MINGDTPALTHALGLKGHSGKAGCRFCHLQGIGKRSNSELANRGPPSSPKPKLTYYPIFEEPANTPVQYRRNPECNLSSLERTPQDLADFITNCATLNAGDMSTYMTDKGIARRTCLWDLQTVRTIYPFIAPEESMHTVFLNVVPQLMDLISGTYFENISIISTQAMEQMGQSLVSSSSMMPIEFAERIPDLYVDRAEFQASTWYSYAMLVMPIQLMIRLPAQHRGPWSRFCWCVQVIHAHVMKKTDLALVESYMIDFIHYLER